MVIEFIAAVERQSVVIESTPVEALLLLDILVL
jgi:hypothetical protein